MDSPLLKYSAKDYFFKAALCHFCIDMLNAKVSPHQPGRLPRLPLSTGQDVPQCQRPVYLLSPYPFVRMENSLDAFLSSQLLAGSLLACSLYGLLCILTVSLPMMQKLLNPRHSLYQDLGLLVAQLYL